MVTQAQAKKWGIPKKIDYGEMTDRIQAMDDDTFTVFLDEALPWALKLEKPKTKKLWLAYFAMAIITRWGLNRVFVSSLIKDAEFRKHLHEP